MNKRSLLLLTLITFFLSGIPHHAMHAATKAEKRAAKKRNKASKKKATNIKNAKKYYKKILKYDKKILNPKKKLSSSTVKYRNRYIDKLRKILSRLDQNDKSAYQNYFNSKKLEVDRTLVESVYNKLKRIDLKIKKNPKEKYIKKRKSRIALIDVTPIVAGYYYGKLKEYHETIKNAKKISTRLRAKRQSYFKELNKYDSGFKYAKTYYPAFEADRKAIDLLIIKRLYQKLKKLDGHLKKKPTKQLRTARKKQISDLRELEPDFKSAGTHYGNDFHEEPDHLMRTDRLRRLDAAIEKS